MPVETGEGQEPGHTRCRVDDDEIHAGSLTGPVGAGEDLQTGRVEERESRAVNRYVTLHRRQGGRGRLDTGRVKLTDQAYGAPVNHHREQPGCRPGVRLRSSSTRVWQKFDESTLRLLAHLSTAGAHSCHRE